MSRVLIVDDDKGVLKSLEMTLSMKGFDTITTTKGNNVLDLLTTDIDAVLLDVNLGHYSGREILKEIKELYPLIPVIMISGLATMDDAVESIKDGAFDFIQKPLQADRLLLSLTNAINFSKLKRQTILTPIYNSKQMEEVISISHKVAVTNASILITGESGVGKDVVANYIHSISKRSTEPLVSINCGAIPESLIESELFGFKKGSFTGSISDSSGKIVGADRGTLFLDEVGELPLSAQVKLLRFLSNNEIQRIGESTAVKVDVRLIVATNRDLLKEVEKGNFRDDLLYRLNIITLEIPPLRERPDDIPPLIEMFIDEICSRMGITRVEIGPEVIDQLKEYHFPGNIRQLKNIIERAIILCQNGIIRSEDIIFNKSNNEEDSLFSKTMPLNSAKHLLESHYIKTQLKKFNGSIKETAQQLDILPNNLSRKIRDLGIKIDTL